MIVTHRSLPPLDHFPQRATVLKKVARVCSREKIVLHGMCDNNTHLVQKVCAVMSVRSSETKSCTLLRMDSFLACSEYGILKTSRSVLFAFELREASCRLRVLNFSRYEALFSASYGTSGSRDVLPERKYAPKGTTPEAVALSSAAERRDNREQSLSQERSIAVT